jgi:hypothetical protein
MTGKGSPFCPPGHNLGQWCSASAEHLVARRDGGGNGPENIVAAHELCNGRRHRCKTPLSPNAFEALVRGRLDKGRWFSREQRSFLGGMLSSMKAP